MCIALDGSITAAVAASSVFPVAFDAPLWTKRVVGQTLMNGVPVCQQIYTMSYREPPERICGAVWSGRVAAAFHSPEGIGFVLLSNVGCLSSVLASTDAS